MYAADVRMAGESRQRAVELLVIGSVELHPATLAVDDGDDAIHVREVLQNARLAHAVGDVLARARGAVHGADDGEVVPRAVAQVIGLVRRRGRSP